MRTDKKEVGTRDAARQLGVSVRTVQLWVERGALRAWKTAGGHRRIEQSSIDALLNQSDLSAPGSALRVLAVEDELTVQAYYQALLDVIAPQAELHIAENGYEGLIELGRTDPNVLLVDVDMPGMDGLAMLDEISTNPATQNIRIAVVTGLSAAEVAVRGGLPDGVELLAKPLQAHDLQRLLDIDQTNTADES